MPRLNKGCIPSMPRVAVARPSRVHTLRSTFSFFRFFSSSFLCSPRRLSHAVTWPHMDMLHWLLRRWCRRRCHRCVSHFYACGVFALRASHLTFSHCTSMQPHMCNIRNCRCAAAVSERHCNHNTSPACKLVLGLLAHNHAIHPERGGTG